MESNKKKAACDLCEKTNNIVQMKGTGEYICQNGCDEEDEHEDEDEEEKQEDKEEGKEEELEVEEFTHKGERYYLVGTKDDGEVYSIGPDEDLGELQGSYQLFISY